jgi:alkylglycerol monooxygenase
MFLSPTVIVIPLFAALIAVEAHLARHLDSDEFADPLDTATNIALGFGSVGFGFVFGLATGLVYIYLYSFAPYKFPADAWWTWVLLFFVDDFVYYWFHRISHESRFLWNFHVVHHSSEHFNLSVAGRQSWFSGVAHWMFYAPIMLLGFAPWMFALMHGLNLIYQFWIHTRFVQRLGWFEFIFNTPSHHRVHHGVNEIYLDKNYAGALIIWDRMFGTFVEETEAPRFGILKPVASYNPLWINTHAWVEMFAALRSRRSIAAKIRCVFASPYMECGEDVAVNRAEGLPSGSLP